MNNKTNGKYKYKLYLLDMPEYETASISFVGEFSNPKDALQAKADASLKTGPNKELFIDLEPA